MHKTLKIAAAVTTIAVAALISSGTAQARFGAGVAIEAETLLQPAHYYGYGYGYRGGYGYGYYAPRYYYPRYYGYRGYYAPRYYRYY